MLLVVSTSFKIPYSTNLLRILNDLLVLGESEYSFNSVLYRCLKTEYDNAKEEALEKVYGKGKSI